MVCCLLLLRFQAFELELAQSFDENIVDRSLTGSVPHLLALPDPLTDSQLEQS
jgi:hypothetical protein